MSHVLFRYLMKCPLLTQTLFLAHGMACFFVSIYLFFHSFNDSFAHEWSSLVCKQMHIQEVDRSDVTTLTQRAKTEF